MNKYNKSAHVCSVTECILSVEGQEEPGLVCLFFSFVLFCCLFFVVVFVCFLSSTRVASIITTKAEWSGLYIGMLLNMPELISHAISHK